MPPEDPPQLWPRTLTLPPSMKEVGVKPHTPVSSRSGKYSYISTKVVDCPVRRPSMVWVIIPGTSFSQTKCALSPSMDWAIQAVQPINLVTPYTHLVEAAR